MLSLQILYNLPLSPFPWEFHDKFLPSEVEKRKQVAVLVSLENGVNSLDNDEKLGFDFNFEIDNVHELLSEPLYVYNEDHFVAGNLHRNLTQWNDLIENSENDVLKWIKDGVDINNFIQPFKGEFWGIQYNHEYPPPRQFQNAKNCADFVCFINSELQERLRSGAISYVGKVGEVVPPYIVSPITIEPTKPRLCINLMYL